jgi:hypothetical protein
MNYDRNEFRVSLERINTTLGYVKTNCVLCVLELNTRCQWSHEKIKSMMNILDQNITDNSMNFDKKQTPRKPSSKSIMSLRNDEKYYNCTYCGEIKIIDEFYPNKIYTGCLSCHQKRRKLYCETPRGFMTILFNGSKCREKNNIKRDCEFDITFDFLVNLFNSQNGLCAYSGLPMHFGSYLDKHWTMSLERINVFKGYTQDNVCLICLEFNGIDRSIQMSVTNSGNGGWTPLKFQLFHAYFRYMLDQITEEELQATIHLQKVTFSREVKRGERRQVLCRFPTTIRSYIASIITKAKRTYGQIFMIETPDGKRYIGQTPILFQAAKTIYYEVRQTGHALIAKELDKHGQDNCVITRILTCVKEKLKYYEELLQEEYRTDLNRIRFVFTETSRRQISDSLIAKTKRIGHDGKPLPKFVKYINWKDRKGYAIISHPKCKSMNFASTKELKTLDESYKLCIEHLDTLAL